MKKALSTLFALIAAGVLSLTQAQELTSTGLTLLESPGARPSALGEAFTAGTDDISAFFYNPAALRTLSHGQASFLYKKGAFEDSHANLSMGVPGKTAWGLSVGYFNGGEELVTDGVTERTITVQKDLQASLGLARSIGKIDVGLTGKYLTSELAETAKASTFAFDAGARLPITNKLNFGLSVQNVGGQLKYSKTAEDLPKIARMGLSMAVSGRIPSTLFIDGVQKINDGSMYPSAGLEVNIGPLALRGGYVAEKGNQHLTLGMGIGVGSLSLNYAMSMTKDIDTPQKISLSIPFGMAKSPTEIVKEKPEQKKSVAEIGNFPATVTFMSRKDQRSLGGMVYLVKQGDTFASIALQQYGDQSAWIDIYKFNQHLLDENKHLIIGQKIRLP